MIRILVFCLAGLSIAWLPTASAGGLGGDPEALARVEAMLNKLGGQPVWANARSLYTMERARHPAYGGGIVATFWRDLENPGEYARVKHHKLDVRYAWNEEGGWIERNGEIHDFSEKEHSSRRNDWYREIYTLYHQLAVGERELNVKKLEPGGFEVLDETGKTLGRFKLTPQGDLYAWEQVGSDEPVAYIYGPHKDFGEVEFPDWGTSTDGSWSFYYLQVRPSEHPFEFHVDMAKPKPHWDGGALNKGDCIREP